jgi:hypothetical protein
MRQGGLLLILLLLAGCRAPRAEVGVLPYYPGAEVFATGESDGRAFGFGPAHWTRTDLTVRAPYERVRDFYAGITPAGWTSTFVNEAQKESGRRYDRFLADGRRRQFYVIQVREEADGVVRITLAWARPAGATPVR